LRVGPELADPTFRSRSCFGCDLNDLFGLWRFAEALRSQYVRAMLAKVHYPGPEGEDRSFDAEVPDPAPRTHTFVNPADGSEVSATLEQVEDAMQPGGGVAIYGANPD
jgi:hypothetical protein